MYERTQEEVIQLKERIEALETKVDHLSVERSSKSRRIDLLEEEVDTVRGHLCVCMCVCVCVCVCVERAYRSGWACVVHLSCVGNPPSQPPLSRVDSSCYQE